MKVIFRCLQNCTLCLGIGVPCGEKPRRLRLALQTGCPSGLQRHAGVIVAKTAWALPAYAGLVWLRCVVSRRILSPPRFGNRRFSMNVGPRLEWNQSRVDPSQSWRLMANFVDKFHFRTHNLIKTKSKICAILIYFFWFLYNICE